MLADPLQAKRLPPLKEKLECRCCQWRHYFNASAPAITYGPWTSYSYSSACAIPLPLLYLTVMCGDGCLRGHIFLGRDWSVCFL